MTETIAYGHLVRAFHCGNAMQIHIKSWLAKLKDLKIRQLAIRILCSVHFDMSHNNDGPIFYKIIKHKQPGTVLWPIIPSTIWHQIFVGKLQFGLMKVNAKHLKESYQLSVDRHLSFKCFCKAL